MRFSLLVVPLLALACATTPATAPSGPPTIGAGRPNFEGKSGGYWVWADAEGWHLRTTSAGPMRDFTGVISPLKGGKIEGLRPARANSRYEKLAVTEKGIEFRLPTQADVEGFDWQVTSGCNRFELKAEGEVTPGLVRLGGMGDAPPQIPFDLCR
jgi:hypothetical protein